MSVDPDPISSKQVVQPDTGRDQDRVNPVAMAGVLLIVIASITIGVIGPQVTKRGNMAVGMPLMDLLDEARSFYDRETRNPRLRNRTTPVILRQSAVEAELATRFQGAHAPDLGPAGFRPLAIDSTVHLDGFEQSGLSVLYKEGTDDVTSLNPGNMALLLYLPYESDLLGVYARNHLGMPVSIGSGDLFIRRLAGSRGSSLWSATWKSRSVVHVLLTPSERSLDSIISTMGLSPPDGGTGLKIADITLEAAVEASSGRVEVAMSLFIAGPVSESFTCITDQ